MIALKAGHAMPLSARPAMLGATCTPLVGQQGTTLYPGVTEQQLGQGP
jgi:hypothetical protein